MNRYARWALFCIVAAAAMLAGSRANDVYRWGAAISGNELAMSHQDSIDAYLGTAIIDWDQLTAAVQEITDQDSLGGLAAGDYLTASPFGASIDWAELSAAAAELADADSLGSLAAADYATVSVLNGHVSDDTGIHGVGGSTVASVLDVTTHAALAQGVHGSGASDLATLSDLATPTITDFTSAAHDHEDAAGGAQIGWAGLTTAAKELADADSLGSLAAADYALQTDLPTQKFALTIIEPTATEDFTIGHTINAITVSRIECVVIGSGSPSLTFSIKFATDRSAAGTDMQASDACSNTTNGDAQTIADATVDANCFIWLESTAVGTTTDEVHITIFYQDT